MARDSNPTTIARKAKYNAEKAAKASQADPANKKLARRAAKHASKAAAAQRRAYAYRKQQQAVAKSDGASTAPRCYSEPSKPSKPSKRRAADSDDTNWREAWFVNHVRLMERLKKLEEDVNKLATDLGVAGVAGVASVASVAGGVAGVAGVASVAGAASVAVLAAEPIDQ